MGNEAYFWMFSASVVILSLFITAIDPLVNQIFGGYLGFINTSLQFGNPIFVFASLALIAMIFGKKHQNAYIEGFVNANLLWFQIFPALYLHQFYDIKIIIIGFCLANIVLSNKCADYLKKKMNEHTRSNRSVCQMAI